MCIYIYIYKTLYIYIYIYIYIGYLRVDPKESFFTIFAMESLLCFAMQSVQCKLCYTIFAVPILAVNLTNVIWQLLGLPGATRRHRKSCRATGATRRHRKSCNPGLLAARLGKSREVGGSGNPETRGWRWRPPWQRGLIPGPPARHAPGVLDLRRGGTTPLQTSRSPYWRSESSTPAKRALTSQYVSHAFCFWCLYVWEISLVVPPRSDVEANFRSGSSAMRDDTTTQISSSPHSVATRPGRQ